MNHSLEIQDGAVISLDGDHWLAASQRLLVSALGCSLPMWLGLLKRLSLEVSRDVSENKSCKRQEDHFNCLIGSGHKNLIPSYFYHILLVRAITPNSKGRRHNWFSIIIMIGRTWKTMVSSFYYCQIEPWDISLHSKLFCGYSLV
jgi:hypothetical protein